MTWIDEQDSTKVLTALDGLRARPADRRRFADTSGGDVRFELWLEVANSRAVKTFGVGIFDISDWTWRDAFEGGYSPRDAVVEAFGDDDLYGPALAAGEL